MDVYFEWRGERVDLQAPVVTKVAAGGARVCEVWPLELLTWFYIRVQETTHPSPTWIEPLSRKT